MARYISAPNVEPNNSKRFFSTPVCFFSIGAVKIHSLESENSAQTIFFDSANDGVFLLNSKIFQHSKIKHLSKKGRSLD